MTRQVAGNRVAQRLVWPAVILVGFVFLAVNLTDGLSLDDLAKLPLLFYLVLGGLIASRLPKHPVGWFILVGTLLVITTIFGEWYTRQAFGIRSGSLPGGEYIAALTDGIAGLGYGFLLYFTFLLFPDGHLPSKRWRVVAWLTLLFMVLDALQTFQTGPLSSYPQVNNPLGIAALDRFLAGIAPFRTVLSISLLILASVSLWVRYHNTGLVERQQIKWVVFAVWIMVMLVGIIIVAGRSGWLGESGDTVLWILAATILPVSIAVAILRYHLFDIDVIIRKTLVYSVVTGLLALVYFGGVLLLQSLFARLGAGQSPAALVLSTLLIAALFNPLRRRVQEAVDRRFYRRKYDAEGVLAAFNAQARDEVDIERLSAALVGAVEETVQPRAVSLWLKPQPVNKTGVKES